MIAIRVVVVLLAGLVGVLGLWFLTGVAATMAITALLNAYPRKAVR